MTHFLEPDKYGQPVPPRYPDIDGWKPEQKADWKPPREHQAEAHSYLAGLQWLEVAVPLEVLLVTGDGCDAVSSIVDDQDAALALLQETATERGRELANEQLRRQGLAEIPRDKWRPEDFDVRVSAPVDGHGIIFSIWDQEDPDVSVTIITEFRYHVRPVQPPADEEVFVLNMAVYDGSSMPDDYLTLHRTRDDVQREIECTANAYGIDISEPTGGPDNGTMGKWTGVGSDKRETGGPWLSFDIKSESIQG